MMSHQNDRDGQVYQEMSDEELVRRFETGDDDALTALRERHGLNIYSLLGDKRLVRMFQNGDDSAFEELDRRYRKRLVRLVGSEEPVQKAFIKAWVKIKRFDETQGTFFNWIAKIASNQAIDDKRKEKPDLFDSLNRPIVNDDGDEITRDQPRPSSDSSPEEITISDEEYQLVRPHVDRCLKELEPIERVALIWRICEEHTYEEVAEILGLQYRAQAERVVKRALRKFKQCYETKGGIEV